MLGTLFFCNSFHNHRHGVVIGATSLSLGYTTVSTFIMYHLQLGKHGHGKIANVLVSDMYPTRTHIRHGHKHVKHALRLKT